MPKKFNFTKDSLAKVAVPEGKNRVFVYDAKTPALAFQLTRSGAGSFYIYRRIDGRPERVRLGGYPEMTVENARKAAAAKNGEIAKGANPAKVKRERRDEITFGELFHQYLEKWAKPRKRTWKDDEAQYDRYLAGWEVTKFSEIDRRAVEELHMRLGKDAGPYSANRALALVSKVFSFTSIMHDGRNPAKGVHRFPEKKRDRFIQPDEFPLFWKALQAEDGLFRDYFTVALFTGARRGNVQAMRWAHVDIDRGVWIIPADEAKAGESIVVPLAPPVVQILRERSRTTGDSPFVFPGRGKSGHVAEVKTSWRRILKAAGLDDLRVHDLRRTLGSWQAIGGASLSVIGKSLGHKSQQTTAIYARLHLDPVRASVDAATAAIQQAAAKPAKPVKVKVVGTGAVDDV